MTRLYVWLLHHHSRVGLQNEITSLKTSRGSGAAVTATCADRIRRRESVRPAGAQAKRRTMVLVDVVRVAIAGREIRAQLFEVAVGRGDADGVWDNAPYR